ncbi:unnamed protein product [Adineta ricciae]|uniref:G-protein coupled receptors family 1 profile domain-containing protein n=1 Tax=Adineta ricciae TaxID=249248 RepID=A0A815ULM2_ADIRI|nr:unnamed protein product [Adineta ricciae]CAF1520820.1 unnamed protein product [Adineta ricciae]
MDGTNQTDYGDYTDSFDSDIALSYPVRFWLLLVSDIPAILMVLFVLHYLLNNSSQRKLLHNHTFILLLFLTMFTLLTDIPLYLNYVRIGSVWPASPATCYVWWMCNNAFAATTYHLMSLASIERHIIIFHSHWLATKYKRLFLHYLPHIAVLIYCFCFYFLAIFFPSCENHFIYTILYCAYPCYYFVSDFRNFWDLVFNGVTPPLIISLFNILLLARVLYQKHVRLHQPVVWRKHRRLTIQVVSVSLLYLSNIFPAMVIGLLRICGYSTEIGDKILTYTTFFAYFTSILLPFVCLGSLPELRLKLKQILQCSWLCTRQTRVEPFHDPTFATKGHPVVVRTS